MFLSTYESSVDAKKRVSIPASFRKALAGEDSVFLWPSIDKPCLEGGGTQLVRGFQRAISRLKPLDPKREALAYAIFGRGRHCRFDEGGRIVLEGELLSYAGITEKASFVGLGDRFQLWSPERQTPRADDLMRIARESGDLLDPFDETESLYAGEIGFGAVDPK